MASRPRILAIPPVALGVLAILAAAGPASAATGRMASGKAPIARPGAPSRGAADPGGGIAAPAGAGPGPGIRPPHQLEFTGVIGWPENSMGCFFDPDSTGADLWGRRVVCVETAPRPPIWGHTRTRGFRRFRRFNRFNRFDRSRRR